MAKKDRNSGFVRQAGIMGQMLREAKAPVSESSAVAQAMAGKDAREEYRAAQARKAAEKPRVSFKFLITGE